MLKIPTCQYIYLMDGGDGYMVTVVKTCFTYYFFGNIAIGKLFAFRR
jgi:hypothetical protein